MSVIESDYVIEALIGRLNSGCFRKVNYVGLTKLQQDKLGAIIRNFRAQNPKASLVWGDLAATRDGNTFDDVMNRLVVSGTFSRILGSEMLLVPQDLRGPRGQQILNALPERVRAEIEIVAIELNTVR